MERPAGFEVGVDDVRGAELKMLEDSAPVRRPPQFWPATRPDIATRERRPGIQKETARMIIDPPTATPAMTEEGHVAAGASQDAQAGREQLNVDSTAT